MRTAALAALLLAACATGPSVKELKSAEIHHDLAVEALQKGAFPDALREYDQALKFDPGMPEAHMGRGLVLEYGFARLKEAEAEYRRAVEIRPAYSEAWNNLGQLLARGGRYDEAVKAFDEALGSAFYREPWKARCNKGLALCRAGRRDEGYAEFRTCLSSAPRYCEGRLQYGRLLLSEGRSKEALDELATAARDCDKWLETHQALGQARMKVGDVAGARTSFERCVELAKGAPAGDECRKSLELLQ